MSLISSITSVISPQVARPALAPRLDMPAGMPGTSTVGETPGFGKVFETMISAVDAKQDQAAAITKDVLLGNNDQLHQGVIAMQEAGVAFQLMVEVRNKLVESYQELMRMPA